MNEAFFAGVRSSVFGGSMTKSQVDGCETIFAAWDRSGDGDDAKLAYLLGTTVRETDRTMQPITEYGAKSYFNKYDAGTKKGEALGNTVKGDGFKYRGRGFVQITGKANYRKAGNKISTDFVGSPDLALRPDIAGMCLVLGCLQGWYTGKKLGDYINKETVDYVNARRVVNGTDHANEIAGHAFHFERAIAAARKTLNPSPAPVTPRKPPVLPEPPLTQTAPKSNSAGWIILAAVAVASVVTAAWQWLVGLFS